MFRLFSTMSQISTHTSRVGCDVLLLFHSALLHNFYSHIPCGMWRSSKFILCSKSQYFYSHIPCGMWHHYLKINTSNFNISTHTSRVGCDFKSLTENVNLDISTHTSRVGCDVQESSFMNRWNKFLLTHPVWDVTFCCLGITPAPYISTHTSRVGCDLSLTAISMFNSISTHTSRVGCDCFLLYNPLMCGNFYSHIPCGMWRYSNLRLNPCKPISTHTSRVGCDNNLPSRLKHNWHFYSHIPCGMWLYNCLL